MLRRMIVLLIVAPACAALPVGCGGGKSTSGTQSSSTSSTAPAAGATSSTGATSTPAPSSVGSVANAVAACKSAIAAAPNLTPALKSKAEGICNKAAGGDIAGAHKAAREVCNEVINAQPVPNALKEQARARCASL
jgi:hypothetical protein